MSKSPGQQLREIAAEATIQIPGASSLLVALLVQEMGFHAVHLSAEGAEALRGQSLDSQQMIGETEAIAPRIAIPSIVDPGRIAPNGAANVAVALQAAGAAAVVFSDGFWEGTEGGLLPLEASRVLFRSIAEARGDVVLVAKTVARRFASLEEAVARAKAYLQAGAEWIQPEGLTSFKELERFANAIDAPLVVSMDEHQETPLLTAEELADLGYAAAIYPLSLTRVAMKAIEGALESLADSGSQHEFLDIMQTDKERAKLLAGAKRKPH